MAGDKSLPSNASLRLGDCRDDGRIQQNMMALYEIVLAPAVLVCVWIVLQSGDSKCKRFTLWEGCWQDIIHRQQHSTCNLVEADFNAKGTVVFKDDAFRYVIKQNNIKQCQKVKDEVLVGTKPPKNRVFDKKGDLSRPRFPQKKYCSLSSRSTG